MHIRAFIAVLAAVLILPAAFAWEYTATFDSDEGFKFFDNDTGAGTAITPAGGVLSVPYPDYGGTSFSWRYIFMDKDVSGTGFYENIDLTGGSVSARISYSGSAAPFFAQFFLAGGGNAGDDLIYIDGAQGGSQTFWGSDQLTIGTDMAWTPTVTFDTDHFYEMGIGTQHDARRGTPDSWANTISSVDAVGLVLGFYGPPPSDARLNIDEFTVTPEPSLFLLSGPLAGFLGWRIRRKGRKCTTKA